MKTQCFLRFLAALLFVPSSLQAAKGPGPASTSEPARWFEEDLNGGGFTPGSWQGVAWADYDQDGDLDLFVSNYSGSNRLYRNGGNGSLTDASDALPAISRQFHGCAWGDYNNDGWPDLFVAARNGGASVLYRNRGDGTFANVGTGVLVHDGGDGIGAAWADYNQDGFLDLFITDLSGRNRLYRNERGQDFVRVNDAPMVAQPMASVGCAWGDYDNDDDLDLFVANGGGINNALYRNDGNGTFTTILDGPVVSDGGYSTGAAWGDYDNDGDLDLFVANRLGPNFLYRNSGNGGFVRMLDAPFSTDRAESNGCGWADFDNDGDLDLFVTNFEGGHCFLYRNDGSPGFSRLTDEPPVSTAASAIGMGAVDYNGDGFVDLCYAQFGGVTRLFRGFPNANRWLKIRLNPHPARGAVIGTRVGVKAVIGGAERWQWREIVGGDGWGTSGFDACFGLGDAAAAELVRVEWPSGAIQEFAAIAPGQQLTVSEFPPKPVACFRPLAGTGLSEAGGTAFNLAWGDYDNDGDPDLFVTSYGGGNRLYRHDGAGHFSLVADAVTAETGQSTSAHWVDTDNDGDLDLFVTNNEQGHFYYLNNGEGTFTKNTTASFLTGGPVCWTAGWADYDNDGHADLLIVCGWVPNQLYHNNGDGTFTRITEGPLVTDAEAWDSCAWGDYDNDGRVDVALASGGDGKSNALYRNLGHGAFERISDSPVVSDGGETTSVAWGDYDNDGDLDLVFGNRSGTTFLYRNLGAGGFERVTTGPVATEPTEANGCAWADYDNDGDLDLAVARWQGQPNLLFRNLGDGSFERVTGDPVAVSQSQCVGVGWSDFTGDGFQDLVFSSLDQPLLVFENTGNANGWLQVKCVGTRSNNMGLGAKVRVKTSGESGDLWQLREVISTMGWGSVGPWPAFGLGASGKADIVRVEWPSGQLSELHDVSANQVLTVVEPVPALAMRPAGGWFAGTLEVALETSVAGGTIRITTDDSDPTEASALYERPLALTQSARVKARVFKDGQPASEVVSGLFLESRWNDGIPAAWREQQFGADWFTKAEAAPLADGDGDRANTFQEWLAGTNPTDGNSKAMWPASVSIYAGSVSGYQDGPRLEALFDGGIPDMAFDGQGRLWLLEASTTDEAMPGPGGHRLRRIEADGTVVTVAGGAAGFADGPAAEARFSVPQGLALGSDGSVFIADRVNHRIRKFDPAGVVSTLAGSVQGYQDGPAGEALFGLPMGVAADSEGNLFVADFMNLRIRRIAPDGVVSTYANAAGNRGRQDGPRLEASFDEPNDVTMGPDGSLFISDWPNQAVRKISPDGMVTTVARTSGWTERVSVDRGGNVYASSSLNAQSVLFLEKFAPDGEFLWALRDGQLAQFEAFGRVLELPNGDLLVGDRYRIRVVHTVAPALLTILTPSGTYEGQVEVAGFQPAFVTGVVRYTLDGSEPSPASTAYDGQRFVLAASATLKARVFVNDNPVSEVVTAEYTVIPTAPSLVQAPQGITVVEGEPARLSVTARGTPPLAYQWFRGETGIPSANQPELIFEAAALADAGGYSVRVSNAHGAITSDAVQLVVTPRPTPPAITRQPEDQAVAVGGTAVFRIEVTGTEPFQFDWRRSGVPVPGGATTVLTLENVQKSQAGSYMVRVTSPHGTAVSRIARLTVTDSPVRPAIVSGPESLSKSEGEPASLSVTATGTVPLRYQWRRNGQPIAGATGASLEFERLALGDAGTYTVTVGNDGGEVVSGWAIVEVRPAAPGGTVMFSNLATAAGVDAPVFSSDGETRLAGGAYLAQLYAGVTAETLSPVGGALPFQSDNGAGYVAKGPSGNAVIVTQVAPGAPAFVQMRAWEATGGASFEAAFAAGAMTGVSKIIQVVTGGSPPSFPADLVGLESFRIRGESEPPTVIIASPGQGITADERFTLRGSAQDNAAVASASWTWNGANQGSLALDGEGRFELPGLRLVPGENRLVVTAVDAAGNAGTGEVLATWEPARLLNLGEVERIREGRQAVIPVSLASHGEVSGLTFFIQYDPARFQDAQFAWMGTEVLSAAFTQVSQEVPGEVRATLSLPGGTVPGGDYPLAEFVLRARSVAAVTSSDIAPRILDVADPTGTRLDYGNAAIRREIEVLPRQLLGDHNGNGFLDVGDATLIQRLVAGIDPAQPWDVTGNDLNESGDLDSGDIVRILRMIVGLDPLPGGGQGSARGLADRSSPGLAAGPAAPAAIQLSASVSRVLPGEIVRVVANLSNGPDSLSGLAFRLTYPKSKLRLAGEQAYDTGEAIPVGTAAVWNSEAAAGRVWFAAAGPRSWARHEGVVAEFEFEVLAGADDAEDIAISVEAGQVAADLGYEVWAAPAATLVLESGVPRLDARVTRGQAGWEIGCWTATGLNYRVEASTDLQTWEELGVMPGNDAVQRFVDADARTLAALFYRVRVTR